MTSHGTVPARHAQARRNRPSAPPGGRGPSGHQRFRIQRRPNSSGRSHEPPPQSCPSSRDRRARRRTGEVKAFIVLIEGGSAEQILGWMRDPATGMASYLVPKHIEFRRSLPQRWMENPKTAAVLRQAYSSVSLTSTRRSSSAASASSSRMVFSGVRHHAGLADSSIIPVRMIEEFKEEVREKGF